MIQELLYTSAPKGLKPGSRGFCTVLSSSGMSAPVATALEGLSGYRPIFPPGDSRAKQNPIVYSHLQFPLAGRRSSVLSRIADYGLDYSQRTNKLAHHVIIDPAERPAGGPAWLLQKPGFMRTSWDGELKIVSHEQPVPQGNAPAAICTAWQQATGDAGWAGVLAENFLKHPERPAYLLVEPGMDLLPLIAEALALLPPERRWEVTFSTYFTKLPQGGVCNWRCVLADTPEANESRRSVQSLRLNLCQPMPPPPPGPYTDYARTGHLAEIVASASTAPPLPTAARPPVLPEESDEPIRIKGGHGSSKLPPAQLNFGRTSGGIRRKRGRGQVVIGLLMVIVLISSGVSFAILSSKAQSGNGKKSEDKTQGAPPATTPSTPTSPSEIRLSKYEIDENQKAGVIGDLSTNLPKLSSGWKFDLEKPSDKFEIREGKLLSKVDFNFEEQARYTVKVVLKEGEKEILPYELQISIIDINDKPTGLDAEPELLAIPENQPKGTVVGKLKGTDPDNGDVLTYSLVPKSNNSDNSKFKIDRLTGEVQTRESIDFDTMEKKVCRLDALVTDQKGESFGKEFTVQISDLKDDYPSILYWNVPKERSQLAGDNPSSVARCTAIFPLSESTVWIPEDKTRFFHSNGNEVDVWDQSDEANSFLDYFNTSVKLNADRNVAELLVDRKKGIVTSAVCRFVIEMFDKHRGQRYLVMLHESPTIVSTDAQAFSVVVQLALFELDQLIKNVYPRLLVEKCSVVTVNGPLSFSQQGDWVPLEQQGGQDNPRGKAPIASDIRAARKVTLVASASEIVQNVFQEFNDPNLFKLDVLQKTSIYASVNAVQSAPVSLITQGSTAGNDKESTTVPQLNLSVMIHTADIESGILRCANPVVATVGQKLSHMALNELLLNAAPVPVPAQGWTVKSLSEAVDGQLGIYESVMKNDRFAKIEDQAAKNLITTRVDQLRKLKEYLEVSLKYIESFRESAISQLVVSQMCRNGDETSFIPFFVYPLDGLNEEASK